MAKKGAAEGMETIEEIDARIDELQAESLELKADWNKLREGRREIKAEIEELLRKRAAIFALREPQAGDVVVGVPGPGGA